MSPQLGHDFSAPDFLMREHSWQQYFCVVWVGWYSLPHLTHALIILGRFDYGTSKKSVIGLLPRWQLQNAHTARLTSRPSISILSSLLADPMPLTVS